MKRLLATLLVVLLAASCDPQKADWGFEGVDALKTPADPPLAGDVTLPADTLDASRRACEFGAGALPEQTLGISPAVAATLPIRHVIVMLKENRSYDHIFGRLHDSLQPDSEPVPDDWFNLDLKGAKVPPFHQTNTCFPQDPGHQSHQVLEGIDGGKMDGFVKSAAESTGTDGHFVMGEYDQTELPFYYWLANTFALSDRHFAPVESGTFANRNFLLFGQAAGAVDTGIVFPPPNTPSILQAIVRAGFTWKAYTDGSPFSGTLDWTATDPGVHTIAELDADLDNGTLPNVAFVDAKEYIEDEHPDADVQTGEAWTKAIYDHVVKSPEWNRLVLFWTYDEAGGFADHVKPPAACAEAPGSPFVRNGPRIPLVAVSPWAKRHYVSHVVHDHTAITRFIELVFHLPALTARDASSDALLDLFDFAHDPAAVGDAPAAGLGDCSNPAPLGSHGG